MFPAGIAQTSSALLVLIEGRVTAEWLEALPWLNPAEDKPNYTVFKMVSQHPAYIRAPTLADSRVLALNIPSVEMAPAVPVRNYFWHVTHAIITSSC